MPVMLNIEMPMCCVDCPCQYDTIMCQALDDDRDFYGDDSAVIDPCEERLPNCPLKEVK